MVTVTATGLATPRRSGVAVRIHAEIKKALDEAVAGGVTNPVALKNLMKAAEQKARKKLGV